MAFKQFLINFGKIFREGARQAPPKCDKIDDKI
ncbi:hypothetical protein BARVI_04810 [Barnesiella viscericola DSM 18177]|uniref:Uncharacterized protein n=1 Tax=Barnesiella viscericola DSM 18177 TaxID=880074 RepID=W0EW15_9BACT|nr:hypothetical protein BARVI_04810 [Barnesiella viscericola DSM 18177]